MGFVVPRNRQLSDLLSNASSEELGVLADIITDNGKGRLALDSKVKSKILNHQAARTLQTIPEVLIAEVRAFGGNSIANVIRSSGVSYRELIVDVARELGGKPSDAHDNFDIEQIVLDQAVSKYRPQAGVLKGADLLAQTAQIVKSLRSAAGSFRGLAARSSAASITGFLGRRVLPLTTPTFLATAAGLVIYQASAPASRITVPAVIQIARIRKIRFEKDFAAYTEALRVCL